MAAEDLPLAGRRCVELSERGAAAYGGKLLHRLGADLVKVEPPGGDPLRRHRSRVHTADGQSTTPAFDYFNDGKRSVVVRGPDELADLVRDVDAFVVDAHPSRYAAWGLDRGTLGRTGARVICAITPFGLSGPYTDYQGPEMVTSAFGGMSVGIGEPGRPPLQMPLMQSAIQGGLVGAIAVMGALAAPEAAPEPTVIDISETDVWATVHAGTTMVSFLFSNRLRRREGRRVLGQPYPHQLFACKDGWIAIQASERHQYQEFVEMVGSPEWATDRRFGSRMEMNIKHANEIDELLAGWFAQRTREEIFAECRARKLPAAPVRSIAEARADPKLVARDCFETYEGATGTPVTVPAPPFCFRSATLRPPGPVPRLEGDDGAA